MSSLDEGMNEIDQSTEIVYLCSPKHYEHLLFTSIRSLLESGSSFDRIVIFCVGQKPKYWDILDPRIQIIEVETLEKDFFMLNKLYSLTRKASRLIFLDVDTLVLNPIDAVYQNKSEDFIGRPTSQYLSRNGRNKWEAFLTENQCRHVPYFNTGFFVFQNSSHLGLFDTWRDLTYQLLDGSIPQSVHGRNNANQIAFSLSLAKSSLSYACMEEHEHMYAWKTANKEIDVRNTVVYHTGSNLFYKYATKLEAKTGLIWVNLPEFRSYPNPVHFHRWKVNLLMFPRRVKQILSTS